MVTLREGVFMEQTFVIDWSETCKICGISSYDSAICLKCCGINFCGWCLERLQNEALRGKICSSNFAEQIFAVVQYFVSFTEVIFAIYGQNRKN